jgi:hypothetical protein
MARPGEKVTPHAGHAQAMSVRIAIYRSLENIADEKHLRV